MATPLPSRPLAKVLSGTCSRAITLPLIGARISFAEAGATVTAPGAALARGRPAKKVSTQASTKATPVPISPPQTLASIPPGGIICAGKKIFGTPNE